MRKDLTKNGLTLRAEFEEMFWPFAFYVGTFSYLFLLVKDTLIRGIHWDWILHDVAYTPILAIVYVTYRRFPKITRKYYELPLWIMGLYANWNQTHFLVDPMYDGAEALLNIFALHVCFCVLPVTTLTFFGFLTASSSIFCIARILSPHQELRNLGALIPSLVWINFFSAVVYYVICRVRNDKRELQQKLIEQIRNQENLIQEQSQVLADAKASVSFGQLAQHVAHDIRSPLSALKVATGTLEKIPESTRTLIRSATQRIEDIANNLLTKNRVTQSFEISENGSQNSENNTKVEWLLPLVESIVSEKRVEFRERPSITIDSSTSSDAYRLFSKMDPRHFQRILSNLINNSVEAIEAGGAVSIEISSTRNIAKISVRDTGKGMSPVILARVSQNGFSHGKKNGSGLGTHHARITIESWRGTFEICSEPGKGTTVFLTLPQAPPPDWFIPQLVVSDKGAVVIVDDEKSIHTLWDKRFDMICDVNNISLEKINFYSTHELRLWLNQRERNGVRDQLFLIDHDFQGSSESGFDFIQALRIQSQSVLVTNRYEEDIQQKCLKAGIKLLPKILAHAVPIKPT